MGTAAFITFFFIFMILLIAFFVIMTIWGRTPIGKSGAGANCQISSDCNTGLVCQREVCAIPQYGSCYDDPNYCVLGTKCINGSCLNITPSNQIIG